MVHQALGLSRLLKINRVSGSAAVRATLNNDSATDAFSSKAFVLSSIPSLVKTAFPIDSDPGPTPLLWRGSLGIRVFNKCPSCSWGKKTWTSLLHMGKLRLSRGVTSPSFWTWFLWLFLMKNGSPRDWTITFNKYLCFITSLALWEMVISKAY